MDSTYLIPVVVFVILFAAFYYNTPEESRSKNLVKCLIPSLVTAALFFCFIKYTATKSEPMMMGNYFD